jgi:Ran GTPase-activating protein (RanGAP) involved in mRNA processing and transport
MQADAESFFAALATNTSLKSLLVSGHKLSLASARALGEALRTNTTLERLSFGDESFGDDGLAALVAGGGVGSSLRCLDLELRGLGALSATLLGAALVGSPQKTPLSELMLGRNRLGDDAVAFEALLRGVCATVSLTSLDLGENVIGEDGAAASLGVLGGHACLSTLRLTGNPIGPSAPIASLVSSLPSLQTLVLEGCALGDGGVAALAVALQSVALTELDVSKNGLGASSAVALAQGLNASLKVLRCGGNPSVGDRGATSFAGALVRAPLQLLDWSRNGATGAGAAALVLGRCARGLVLLGNTLGDSGALEMAAALRNAPVSPPVLEELDLTGAGFTGACLAVLLPPLEHMGLTSLVLGGNKFGAEGRVCLDSFGERTGVSVAYDTEAAEEAEGEGEGGEETGAAGALAGGVESMAAASPSPESDASPQWIGKLPPTAAKSAVSAASAAAAASRLSLRDEVTITGLAAAARYNGLRGVVSSGLVNGRYSVWVDSEKKNIAVKPENIQVDLPSPP